MNRDIDHFFDFTNRYFFKIIVPSLMKIPSQMNLIAVGRKLWAQDWLLLLNPSPLMLRFWFRRRFNGNHCSCYEKCIVNSICNCIQFCVLLDQSINLFMSRCLKSILFEATRSFQRLPKVHDKTKRKLSHFLLIESLPEIKPETQMSYLELWLDQRFKSKAFSDAVPSKMLSTS